MAVQISIGDSYQASLALQNLALSKKEKQALAWFILSAGDWIDLINLFEKVEEGTSLKFGPRHYERGIRRALKTCSGEDASKLFIHMPRGASYEKMRRALLDHILHRATRTWLTNTYFVEWRRKAKFMRSEAELIVKKVLRSRDPELAAELLFWNDYRQTNERLLDREMGDGEKIDQLFNIVTHGSDFSAAEWVFQKAVYRLQRGATEEEAKALVAAMARGALLTAESGDYRQASGLLNNSLYFGLLSESDRDALNEAIAKAA